MGAIAPPIVIQRNGLRLREFLVSRTQITQPPPDFVLDFAQLVGRDAQLLQRLLEKGLHLLHVAADEGIRELHLRLDGDEGVATLALAAHRQDRRHQAREEVAGTGDANPVLRVVREIAGDGDLEAGALVCGYVLFAGHCLHCRGLADGQTAEADPR